MGAKSGAYIEGSQPSSTKTSPLNLKELCGDFVLLSLMTRILQLLLQVIYKKTMLLCHIHPVD
jgi:hypothetical protein